MFIRSLQCSIIYCWILLNRCIVYLFEHYKLGVVPVYVYFCTVPLTAIYYIIHNTISDPMHCQVVVWHYYTSVNCQRG